MANKAKASGERKLTPEEFVNRALIKLRDPQYPGIHTVYSGFNQAFRKYFADERLDPIEAVKQLVEEGKIKIRPCKGGAKIYHPNEFNGDSVGGDQALKKMGL